jgi:5-methyltetrahydrofolate--homocysteine methyltransferase
MKGYKILFSEEDWQKRIQDYTAWWKGELKRPLVLGYGPREGVVPAGKLHYFLTGYSQETSPEEIVSIVEDDIAGKVFYGDAYPSFWPNFGPGVVSAFVGLADISLTSDTVWFKPKEINPLSEIHVVPSLDNPLFKRIKDITQEAVERFGSRVQVGFPDLGGNLDILVSFRTAEKLLIDLIDCPEEVERVLWESHEAWWTYYREFDKIIKDKYPGTVPWACTWAPGRTYMLQCDFSYMISPEMFTRFVLPELRASCKKLDYSFYHLDGAGQLSHLDTLLHIPELHGIQWIPGAGNAPADTWIDLLNKIRQSGKLVQLYATCQGTLNVLRQIGGRGFMFCVTDSLTSSDADEFFDEVSKFNK